MPGVRMDSDVLQKLAAKSLSKEQLLTMVKKQKELIPVLLTGVSSPKPAVRYGCAKVLMDLSEEKPELLYPQMDFFRHLLTSKHRILTWNAIITIANLTRVDQEKKFDAMFEEYYRLLDDPYMVTVANVVGNSGKIAKAKPYLTTPIVEKLLRVEVLATTPHLSAECKQVIAEHAIRAFDQFFPQIEQKEKVLSFVKKQLKNKRKTLRIESENFLKKWE